MYSGIGLTNIVDPRVFVDGTCDVPDAPVDPDSDCPGDILMLCNGVRNCDDCADEVYETCMAYDCSYSKHTPLYMTYTCTCIPYNVHVQS